MPKWIIGEKDWCWDTHLVGPVNKFVDGPLLWAGADLFYDRLD